MPTLSFVINSFALEVEDGTASTGRLVWRNESKISIFEAMRRGAESPDAVTEAAEWPSGFPRRTYWLHPKESREQPSEQQ